MIDNAPEDLRKLVGLLDAIQNFRTTVKTHLQNKLREYNYDLTFEMFQVLTVLWRKNNINQQEIADRVQKNKASLTPLLDNLSKRNLVVRNEDPVDRRNKIISLTKEGLEYQHKLQPMINEFYGSFNIDISLSEIENVTKMLQKLNHNISNI